MKNNMQDLNNHLFAQLERLNDESIGHNEMSQEIEKAKAMAQVGKVLSKNAHKEVRPTLKLIAKLQATTSEKLNGN